MKLQNKIVLITGSSRGIGKATALLFAKEGASVIINYTSSEKEALSLLEELKSLGSDSMAIRCDVSKEDEVEKMINEIISKYKRIDVLVNNAGIVYDVPLFERSIEQWDKTLKVNLFGTYICSKLASQEMLKNKGGVIVNVSSTNAINSFSPEAIDYDASKAGIIALTKDFAKALAPKVRVNAIAPGWVNTDMNSDLPEDFIKEETEKIYVKRFAEAEEIAKVILFLASDDSRFINGSVVVADGGHD